MGRYYAGVVTTLEQKGGFFIIMENTEYMEENKMPEKLFAQMNVTSKMLKNFSAYTMKHSVYYKILLFLLLCAITFAIANYIRKFELIHIFSLIPISVCVVLVCYFTREKSKNLITNRRMEFMFLQERMEVCDYTGAKQRSRQNFSYEWLYKICMDKNYIYFYMDSKSAYILDKEQMPPKVYEAVVERISRYL